MTDLPGVKNFAECLAPRPAELPPVPDGHAWFCCREHAVVYFEREESPGSLRERQRSRWLEKQTTEWLTAEIGAVVRELRRRGLDVGITPTHVYVTDPKTTKSGGGE
jgi:hypothetical protein